MPLVSLCLIPGIGCEPLPGDSPLARHGLSIGSKYFNFIFDTAGLYHFKSRFRPRFETRYLCADPRITLGSGWSFIRLLGVLNLNPRNRSAFCGGSEKSVPLARRSRCMTRKSCRL